MSMDFNIYLKDPEKLSVVSCNNYFGSHKLNVEVYPEWEPLRQFGFLPFWISGNILSPTEDKNEFVSGFEYLMYPYEPC